MEKIVLKPIVEFFKLEPVEAVYLFGSHAKNTSGSMSDYDIAILFKNALSAEQRFEKLILHTTVIAQNIGVNEDRIDITDLSRASFPLAFAAISGKVLFDSGSMVRPLFETKIMAHMHTDYCYIKNDYKSTIDSVINRTYFL